MLGGEINNTLTLSPVSSATTCEDSSVPVCCRMAGSRVSDSCKAQPVYQGKLGKQNQPQGLQLEMYVELVEGRAAVRTTGGSILKAETSRNIPQWGWGVSGEGKWLTDSMTDGNLALKESISP